MSRLQYRGISYDKGIYNNCSVPHPTETITVTQRGYVDGIFKELTVKIEADVGDHAVLLTSQEVSSAA
jgi:hypothetical protein